MESYRQTIDKKPATAKPAHPGRTAAWAALLSALCTALACADASALVLYPLATAGTAACLCAARRKLTMLLPMAAAMLPPIVLFRPFGAAAAAMMLLIPATGALIGVMQKKHLGGFYTAAAAAAAGIACLYAMVCLPGILDGSGAFFSAQTYAERLSAALLQLADPDARRGGVQRLSRLL